MIPSLITPEYLERLDACQHELAKFRTLFPDGMFPDAKNWAKCISAGLLGGVLWALRRLDHEGAKLFEQTEAKKELHTVVTGIEKALTLSFNDLHARITAVQKGGFSADSDKAWREMKRRAWDFQDTLLERAKLVRAVALGEALHEVLKDRIVPWSELKT